MTWYRLYFRGLLLCLLLACVDSPVTLAWDDAPESHESSGELATETTGNLPVDAQKLKKERRFTAYVGLMALVGIVVVGLAIVALVILWAGRLRRINRALPARTVVKDELWFLQPARPGNDLPNRNPPAESVDESSSPPH